MSKCRPVTRAWSPVWYKLDCNDITFTSSDDSVTITRLDGDCCGWDFQAIGGGGGGTGSVTSIGLTMPSAFNVANSPVTTSGVIAVTGAGTIAQYIRGDGTLATFPTIPTYTANNGLTMTLNNSQLGGTLLQHTTVTNGGFGMTFSNNTSVHTLTVNNSSSGHGLEANNTGNGNAIFGSALSGIGGAFNSSSGFAVTAQSNTNTALITSGILGAQMTAFNTTTLDNSITLLRVVRSTGASVPSNNVGGSIDFHTYTSNLTDRISSSLISRWTNVVDASRTSQFEIWGLNNMNFQQLSTVKGTGQHQYNRYGIGTFTGTAAYALYVDTSGNIIEGGTDGFYTTSGSLTSPRVVDGAGFSLTYEDLTLFRIQNGDTTIGGTYDFTTGVDLLAYNATNSSNLTLDPLSGMKFQYTTLAGPVVNSSLEVTPTGVRLTGIQEFADNAAAITGGLTSGYLYRTGDVLKIVH